MGCFDSNCCVTGLPIHHYDKVRAAILIPEKPEQNCSYVGSSYQFWTMPVSSEYNDYGNIEWEKIAEEHRWSLEYVLKLMLPAMRDHEQYSRKILENDKKLTLNELWDFILHGSLDFDPDREIRHEWTAWRENGMKEEDRPRGFGARDQIKFRPWMCHEWAYQEVLNIQRDLGKLPIVLKDHANNYCCTRADFDAEVEEKGLNLSEDATEEERRAWHEVWSKYIDSEKHWIEGEQGGIAREVHRMIQTVEEHPNHQMDRSCCPQSRRKAKRGILINAHAPYRCERKHHEGNRL